MQVIVTTPRGETVFQLESSPASQSLWAQLPFRGDWRDFGGTEKITHPPKALLNSKVTDSHAGRFGELCYYAPWGNLAYFRRSSGGPPAPGLILLGRVVSGAENLDFDGPLAGTVKRLDDSP